MTDPTPATLSVTELNRKAKSLLELHLNRIWVEGEVSNLSQPGSGHWYFSLKDDGAQIRCAMFRNRNLLVKTRVRAGDQVKVRGRVSLYEPRGDYQLIVDHLEPAGEGALQRQFELLKQTLANEGLFAQEHKKALPEFAAKIAVVSSPTGAALQDILQVLERRNPNIEVIVVPSIVQGSEAPASLCRAFRQAQKMKDLDAIIIGRGGGSIEDLWAFNDETLARLIFDCEVPVISAVGHEIDFSITDFVADLRAPTPSAAAELISFDLNAASNRVTSLQRQLLRTTANQLSSIKQNLLSISKRLKHPGDKLHQWQQRTDYCEDRLLKAIQKRNLVQSQRLSLLKHSLGSYSPKRELEKSHARLSVAHDKMHKALEKLLELKRSALAKVSGELNIVSPLATLERGYVIAKTDNNNVARSVRDTGPKETLRLRFHDGEAITEIKEIYPDTLL